MLRSNMRAGPVARQRGCVLLRNAPYLNHTKGQLGAGRRDANGLLHQLGRDGSWGKQSLSLAASLCSSYRDSSGEAFALQPLKVQSWNLSSIFADAYPQLTHMRRAFHHHLMYIRSIGLSGDCSKVKLLELHLPSVNLEHPHQQRCEVQVTVSLSQLSAKQFWNQTLTKEQAAPSELILAVSLSPGVK